MYVLLTLIVKYCSFVPTTANDVRSNPAHGVVLWIQHHAIKFVSDLREVGCFLQVLWFPPPIQLTATI
jgi:hypothetical protein